MMHLLDIEALTALASPRHVFHHRVSSWLGGSFATTALTETEFLRRSPSIPEGLRELADLRAMPGHRFLVDDTSLADPYITVHKLSTPAQVTAVHLVNLAAASGITLATLDGSVLALLSGADKLDVVVIP